MTLEPDRYDCDVAIVGYGPTGVTAANFLGHYGMSVIAVERSRDVYPRARAVTVDDFTLRLYQSVGLDEALKANMDPRCVLRWKTYSGIEFLRLEPKGSPYGQPASSMIYQPAMEATLRQGAERFANVTTRFGVALAGLTPEPEGVRLELEEVDSGQRSSLRARYVLACDGGSSTTRGLLGIGLRGDSLGQTWVIIDGKVKRWWPERDLLTFWADPERPVVDIPLALDHHRWELPLRPGETREDLESDDALWDLITPLGVTRDRVEIIRHAFYEHHVLQAEQWRQGRVFLLGDAAHMMPPWAGQGMQSGIRDAQNLAWKLAGVLRGQLPEAVLDTYQPEREPHVVAMTKLSQGMGKLIGTQNRFLVGLRNRGLNLLGKLPVTGPAVRELRFKPAPQLTAGFLTGTPGRKSAVGQMIPQPRIAVADGRRMPLDDALGDGIVVLGADVDPLTLMTPSEVAAWREAGARFVILRSLIHPPESDSDLVDYLDILCPWLAARQARVVILRPDRFVLASDASGLSLPELAPAPPATATPVMASDARAAAPVA